VSPEPRRLQILVVDDDPAFRRLVLEVIAEAGYDQTAWCETGGEALRKASVADLILLDHQLPDSQGLDLLPVLRTLPARPAVILVTAHGDEALAARALRAGADDYLIKDPALPGLLPQVIERVRRHRALAEALAAAERDLVHAERMAAIGQLSVTLSHSINNPLMAALTETELLLSDPAVATPTRGSLGSIKEALLRIREILERVSSLQHDETTDYLDGIPMIDLSRRTRPMPVPAGEALVWLSDEGLARVVGSLLKHAGFSVTRVADLADLARRAPSPIVTAVVLLGAGPRGVDPLGGFRPGGRHEYTLVALAPDDGVAARDAGADLVVRLPFDPGTFAGELLAARRQREG
jgi:DNA-binding response OmpR family regulator